MFNIVFIDMIVTYAKIMIEFVLLKSFYLHKII